jgi:hypothetical protein
MSRYPNVALYPKWQKFLHDHQPKSLILWGQNDMFFTREGGEAYLNDLPDAEISIYPARRKKRKNDINKSVYTFTFCLVMFKDLFFSHYNI